MIMTCSKGHACVGGLPFVCPWCIIAARDEEIERLKRDNMVLESKSNRANNAYNDLQLLYLKKKEDLAAMTKERDDAIIHREVIIAQLDAELANERKALELACYEIRYGFSHEKDLIVAELPDYFRKKAMEK